MTFICSYKRIWMRLQVIYCNSICRPVTMETPHNTPQKPWTVWIDLRGMPSKWTYPWGPGRPSGSSRTISTWVTSLSLHTNVTRKSILTRVASFTLGNINIQRIFFLEIVSCLCDSCSKFGVWTNILWDLDKCRAPQGHVSRKPSITYDEAFKVSLLSRYHFCVTKGTWSVFEPTTFRTLRNFSVIIVPQL